MKTQNTTYQKKQLALEDTVRDCIQEIFRTSLNESEARLGLDALQKVVIKVQNRENLKPAPRRISDRIPETKHVMVHKLTEALMTDTEDGFLNKVFRGDKDAIQHFKETKAGRFGSQSLRSVIAESAEHRLPTHGIETEKAKKAATETGDLLKLTQICKAEDRLFTPYVGIDGKLNFTGKFRKMENRHA